MSEEIYNDIPTAYRGLRVLLVDKDTSTLFNIAKEMECFSYRVTTTEAATLALSILEERKDSFDLVVTDINMHESECLEFIQSLQLIKDLPIILMSTEVDKDMIKEAMMKGACFFLRKPISLKNLKNLWQHVVRQNKYRNLTTENNAPTFEQEADSELAKIQEKNKAIERDSQEYGSEHVRNQNNQDHKKTTENRTKRSMSTDNDEHGDFKRRKTEIESSEKEKANRSSNSDKGHSNNLKSLVEHEREREVRDNGSLENQLRVDQIHDAHLKLKGVIDADGKGEARPESVLDITKELNFTQPQIFNHMQKCGVGTIETHFNKHGQSGRSVDIYEKPASRVDVDKIQVFPDSSQSLSTFLEEVGSRKKYHKGARFL